MLLTALFYFSVYNYGSVTVNQHAQHHEPDSEEAKWNSAIIHFIYLSTPVILLL